MPHSPNSPHLSTLILLSALAILPINVFLPSLPHMAAGFGVDYGIMSLSLAAYAGVSALLQMLFGPLSDRYGRRPLILFGILGFQVGTVGCILADDISTFLVCRMIQAVIAPTYAVALAVIRDTSRQDEAASRIGFLSMAWAVAPMLGPAFGGWLDETLGWRAIFGFLGLFGMVVFFLCLIDLRETNLNPCQTLKRQFLAYPELLISKRFWAYALCLAFSVGTFFAFLAGVPLVAATAYDLPPASLGVLIGSITGGFMAGSFLSGKLARRMGPLVLILAGRWLACLALVLGLALTAFDFEHAAALFGPCMLVGLSNGLTLPSANAGAISVRPKLAGSAAGLAGAISVAGGGAMAWATGASLSEENARHGLWLVMLASASIALIAAIIASRLERMAGINTDAL